MLFKRVLQKVWDWRAAGNFIFGGCGSGLLLISMTMLFDNASSLIFAFIGMVFVGMGLFSVWLKIGKPFRALNVFFNPKTSWMSREAIIAVVLFGTGFFYLLTTNSLLGVFVALFAVTFLYCQAKILKVSKGIPAWRASTIMPLIMITGLAEGAGAMLVLANSLSEQLAIVSIVAAVMALGRYIAFVLYSRQLKQENAPEGAIAVVDDMNTAVLVLGTIVPLLLIALAFVTKDFALVISICAGALMVLAGWYMKFLIIVRAAHYQGYGFPMNFKRKNVTA